MDEKQINELYHVLMRQEDLRQEIIRENLNNNEYQDNKELCVQFFRKSHPKRFMEALAIVNDSSRETVTLYRDDLDSYRNKFQQLEFEKEELFHLFNDYLSETNTRSKFLNYLYKLKKKIDEEDDNYIIDIDQHIKDFS